MANNQVFASDVTIDKLVIHSSFGQYDLMAHLVELNIYENIFKDHLSANLTLVDSFNLPYKLPICGEETIEIVYRLSGHDGATSNIVSPPLFHIHEIKGRFLKTPQSQQFTLALVSEQYMSNTHTRVCKAYSDGVWTADEIVSDIWSNYLDDGHGDLEIEPAGRLDCIVPNWTPFETFKWICDRAHPEDEESIRNYLYYETMDTTYFTSLNNLVNQTKDNPVVTFTKVPRANDASKVEGLSANIIKVESISYINQFQKVKNINEGLYCSKLITHDIVKKKILQHDYTMYDDFDTNKNLGEFPLTSDSETEYQTGNTFRHSFAPPVDPSTAVEEGRRLSDYTDSRVNYYPKHDNMYAINTNSTYDNKVEDWKQRRASQIMQYNGVQMQVKCFGISFLRIGMVVNLFVPSPESTSRGNSEDAYDKYLTGKYMITAIRHILGYDKGEVSYGMLLELRKDALEDEVGSRMPQKLGNE
jgi:hypothetical protein